jgi:tyrosine-protein kinase Etk/Wzc
MNTPLNQAPMQQQEEETINLREILDKYLYHWKWFALGAFVTLSMAFVYLRYSVSVYESKASVLIKDEKKGGFSSELSMLKDLGVMGGSSNLQDEIEVFKSRTLIEIVAKSLRLNFTLHLIGDKSGFVRGEVYDRSPLSIQPAQNDSLYYETEAQFEIRLIDKDHYQLTEYDGADLGTYRFGAVVKTKDASFIVNRTTEYKKEWQGKHLLLSILPMNDVVTNLQKEIAVESVNKEAMVLNISIKGPQIQKNNDIINELIRQHEIDAIEDKNVVATNTSQFITERMKFIASELSEVEGEGQDYKTKYKLVDVASDAALYLEQGKETEKAIMESSIQLSLAEFMNEYIQKHQGYSDLLPANLGFKDNSIALMTTQYNELVLERNRLLQNSGEKNPTVQKIEGQLAGIKNSLNESLKNLRSALQLELKKLKNQEGIYQSKIASIPQYEREYRDILRQQQIKETLYLFLLQKREENEITLAASVSNMKVVDQAYSDGEPVSPKKKIIYLGALLMGLILPAGFIYVRDLLDNKVQGKKDLEALGLPVIGEIPKSDSKEQVVVRPGERSSISEAFRLLRTNVKFMLDTNIKGGKVIFFTSTLASEGKSFNSVNFAHTLALSGKKTVLVGMDLRAPKLLEYLEIPDMKGVTNYLTDVQLTLEDITLPISDMENLWFIASGTIPPNPAELLERERIDLLFETLKENYEYIVVDTAPVGLVTDTLLITPKADLVLYVVRSMMLESRMLSIPKSLYDQKKLGKVAFLMNRTTIGGGAYGYGYGYEDSLQKKSFFQRIFRK